MWHNQVRLHGFGMLGLHMDWQGHYLTHDFQFMLCGVAQVTTYVEREIINHRSLNHPHVVQFKEVRSAWQAGVGHGLGRTSSLAYACWCTLNAVLLCTQCDWW